MANQKISALPEATLPLEGNESVPLIQEGANCRAPASAFMGPRRACARVADDGTLLLGKGITSVERSSTGVYVVNFTAAGFQRAPFCVASSNKECSVIEEHGTFSTHSQTATQVVVDVHDKDGTRIDCPFTLICESADEADTGSELEE